jgi:3,4-dihydroxy 2-butanone 4-phosphate synthase/GTP cyclohydrolase II
MAKLRVQCMTCARVPTSHGEFQLCLYRNNQDSKEHLALVLGAVAREDDVLVRVHSECFTGDVLGSLRCDCGEQLDRSLEMVAAEGQGIIVYLRQEGRGIGLLDKLRAYNLQDGGLDTVDANLVLGHQADERDYSAAAAILEDLQVRSVRLLTNNPSKIDGLRSLGVDVRARVALPPSVTAENAGYLHAKADRMNHWLVVEPAAEPIPVTSRRDGHEHRVR